MPASTILSLSNFSLYVTKEVGKKLCVLWDGWWCWEICISDTENKELMASALRSSTTTTASSTATQGGGGGGYNGNSGRFEKQQQQQVSSSSSSRGQSHNTINRPKAPSSRRSVTPNSRNRSTLESQQGSSFYFIFF